MNKVIQLTKESIEIQHLIIADSNLGKLITVVGDYKITIRTDYFKSLVKLIISQQLSNKAADTIYNRIDTLLNKAVTPDNISLVSEMNLHNIGISKSKTSYIKNLSFQILNKTIDLDALIKTENADEIFKNLISIKGIGPWTAEMFLIFSLGRLNILSYKDIGLKRAIKWLYKLDNYPNDEFLEYLSNKWSPYQTVASFYLWEVINQGFIKYSCIEDIIMYNKKQ